LLFFTNDSRKDNKGIERVGHVALYLGDNLILHTASDYAKIEEISTKRWSYFIQAQRMV
jgi:cell wall-associated NlpC family hydrolase